MDLAALNAASAKIGVFPCRVLSSRVESYSWQKSGQMMVGQYMTGYLVGQRDSSYCVATFRGSKTDVENAAKKFSNNSTWLLTSVKCDAKTKTEYVSSPIKYVVALHSSKLEPKDNQNLPKILRPTFTCAEVVGITTSGLYFDIAGLIRSVSEKQVYGDRAKVVCEMVDDSKTSDGAGIALVSVGIWQNANDAHGLVVDVEKAIGQTVLLSGVKSAYEVPSLNLNTSRNSILIVQEDSVLMSRQTDLLQATVVESLTVVNMKPEVDGEQPAAHACLHVLAHLSQTTVMFQVWKLKLDCYKLSVKFSISDLSSYSPLTIVKPGDWRSLEFGF